MVKDAMAACSRSMVSNHRVTLGSGSGRRSSLSTFVSRTTRIRPVDSSHGRAQDLAGFRQRLVEGITARAEAVAEQGGLQVRTRGVEMGSRHDDNLAAVAARDELRLAVAGGLHDCRELAPRFGDLPAS